MDELETPQPTGVILLRRLKVITDEADRTPVRRNLRLHSLDSLILSPSRVAIETCFFTFWSQKPCLRLSDGSVAVSSLLWDQ